MRRVDDRGTTWGAVATLLVVLVGLVGAGCASAPPADEPGAAPSGAEASGLPGPVPGLSATVWAQLSAGYRATALQTYRMAEQALQRALEDPDASALVDTEETDGPPAVILDVDETVLDNSFYQARRLRQGAFFTTESWHEWVREASAPPVPGALEFVRAAEEAGVAVFYVTNRDHVVEEATLRNLQREGFPVDSAGERLMTQGERPDWGSDKGSRRRAVAADHRVVLLLGDDFNDFVSGARASTEAYRELVDRHEDRFGVSWFMLPNPMYGTWDRASVGFRSGLTVEERIRAQLEALETSP